MIMKYTRVLLKLSGEAFTQENSGCLEPHAIATTANEIAGVLKKYSTLQLAIVVGGGNIFRGAKEMDAFGMNHASADMIGMLGTEINAIALGEALHTKKIKSHVLSALSSGSEQYSQDHARSLLEQRCVVLCAGGTGNPFFTTDTAAALRAVELGCDVVLKATKVDGVYSADPVISPSAARYATLTYTQALKDNLHVMDAAALSLCRDNALPTIVFNFFTPGNLLKVIEGKNIGTIITP